MATLTASKYQNIRIRVLLIQRRIVNADAILDNLSSWRFSLKNFLKATVYSETFLEVQTLKASDLCNIEKSYALYQNKPISDAVAKSLYRCLQKIDFRWIRPLFAIILTDAYLTHKEITLNWSRHDVLEYIFEK